MAKFSDVRLKDKENEIVKMEARLQKKKAELRRLKEREAIDLGRRVCRVFGSAFPDTREEQNRFLQYLKGLYEKDRQLERDALPVMEEEEMETVLPVEEGVLRDSALSDSSGVSESDYDLS